MPNITINEHDLTRGTAELGTDIVFIPGFVKDTIYAYREAEVGETAEYKYDSAKKEYVQATTGATHVKYQVTEYNKPILCTSIFEFENMFGTEPYVFTEKCTFGNITIDKDTPDKSYIMAKELLSMGMPIYYYALTYDLPVKTIGTPELINTNIFNQTVTLDQDIDTSGDYQFSIKLADKLLEGTTISIKTNSSDSRMKILFDPEYGADNRSKYTLSEDSDTFTLRIELEVKDSIKIAKGSFITFAIELADASKLTAFYTNIMKLFNAKETAEVTLLDKGEYTIKYITTGGYPNFIEIGEDDKKQQIYTAMMTLAAKRGDCVALVEDIFKVDADLTGSASFFKKLDAITFGDDIGSYGTAFTPWGQYTLNKSYKITDTAATNSTIMPACFGYLKTLALNIKSSPNWLAMAGTTRGLVPGLQKLALSKVLSNTIADMYQPTAKVNGTAALNAITNVKPYGLCIWGNRTLKEIGKNGLVATNFLNTRNMLSDIKKLAYNTAKELMFEQNNEILWLNFKSAVVPFLDRLKSGAGISDYKLIKLPTHYDGRSLGKEEFACAIQIYPLYAVEAFEININILDTEVSLN